MHDADTMWTQAVAPLSCAPIERSAPIAVGPRMTIMNYFIDRMKHMKIVERSAIASSTASYKDPLMRHAGLQRITNRHAIWLTAFVGQYIRLHRLHRRGALVSQCTLCPPPFEPADSRGVSWRGRRHGLLIVTRIFNG